jgi:enoyl-CoA hydratase
MSKANLSVNDGIALLTLDDGKANALGFDMQADISAALDEAEAKSDVLVITGRAGVTSAGFDLKVMREQPDKVDDMVTGGGLLLTRLFDFPKPVIVASTGHAIAAGALLMLTGDYRLGIEGDSQYGLNETAIGMTLPHFGVELAKFKVAKTYLDRAFVSAELYAGEAALAAGYLDAVMAPDALMDAAMEKAKAMQALDAKSYTRNKRLIRGAIADDMRRELTTGKD